MAIHISYPHPFFLWKHVKASWTTVTPLVEWIFPPTSGHEPSLYVSSLDHTLNTQQYLQWTHTRNLFLPILAAILLTLVCCPLACHRPFVPLPARLCQPSTLLPPSPPYICQTKLFNQQTSVQAPAHIPSKDPPIRRYIFATFPFLSAHWSALYSCWHSQPSPFLGWKMKW